MKAVGDPYHGLRVRAAHDKRRGDERHPGVVERACTYPLVVSFLLCRAGAAAGGDHSRGRLQPVSEVRHADAK